MFMGLLRVSSNVIIEKVEKIKPEEIKNVIIERVEIIE